MKRWKVGMIVLGVLAGILAVPDLQAREWMQQLPGDGGGSGGGGIIASTTWNVPGDVATLPEALVLARPGDIIEIEPGIHQIEGTAHRLPMNVLIRAASGPTGSVVLEEHAGPGQWRMQPVFIVDAAHTSSPVADAWFQNITFRNFTRAYWPNVDDAEPIFRVDSGRLVMNGCTFDTYHGTAVVVRGGSGLFNACDFLRGRGAPTVFDFQGDDLELFGCNFRENSTRHPGDWLAPQGKPRQSLVKVVSGCVFCDCNTFEDNGPAPYLIDVEPAGRLRACTSCLEPNLALKEGRVAGIVALESCVFDPLRWDVVDGGQLLILDDDAAKAAIETRTLSQVKSLFE